MPAAWHPQPTGRASIVQHRLMAWGAAYPRAVAVWGLLLGLQLGGCEEANNALQPGAGDSLPRIAASASTIVGPVDGRLWVVSPDDDTLVAIDAQTLAEVLRVPLSDEPNRVAVADEWLVVGTRLGQAVYRVDTTTLVVAAIPVPCGGTAGIVAHQGLAYITCADDDRLVVVDLADASVVRWLPLPGRPQGVTTDGDALWVTRTRAQDVVRLSLPLAADALPQVVWQNPDPVRAASQLDAITLAADGRPVAAYQSVDNDGDRSRPPEDGGYGSVVDGNPRIAPALTHPTCDAPYARFDGGPRVMSGPSAVASGPTGLWVVHQYTGTVALVDCSARQDGLLRVRATWQVGDGARGIVVAPDGRTAWVDISFDHAVARLVYDGTDRLAQAPAAVVRRAVDPVRLSVAGQQGRRIFHDARDVQLTPSGIVACATCHPDGGEDSLSWFLHTPTVSRRVRRTPAAWDQDVLRTPLHWDAEFTDGDTLVRRTIVGLMGGLALGVDARAVSTWLSEQPAPPGRPVDQDPAVTAGAALFATACASCHLQDGRGDGQLHDVLPPSADPDARLPRVRTPSLWGVRGRAPYGHDGRAPSLRALLTDENPDDRHGVTSQFSPPEIDALIAYVESL